MQGRGPRETGMMVVHVVTASCNTLLLQSLLNDRLIPLCSAEDTEIQVSTTHWGGKVQFTNILGLIPTSFHHTTKTENKPHAFVVLLETDKGC